MDICNLFQSVSRKWCFVDILDKIDIDRDILSTIQLSSSSDILPTVDAINNGSSSEESDYGGKPLWRIHRLVNQQVVDFFLFSSEEK